MKKTTFIRKSQTIVHSEINQAIQIHLETRVMAECYDDNVSPPNVGDSPPYGTADEKLTSFPHSSGALASFNGKADR